VLSMLVPTAVVVTVTAADWISGVVIAVTLPLIPLFAALVGLHTKAATRRQWALLARLGGHFLDVVQGLPTLKAFGRAKFQEQVIAKVTDEHRSAAMATLHVAFLSALVLELSAALATALVAVETGLRLLYGHMPYQTALLVLLLTPKRICRCGPSPPGTTPARRAAPPPRASWTSWTSPCRRGPLRPRRPGPSRQFPTCAPPR
jgi:ATP-binding cassette subfamily C protein CydD